MKNFRKMKIMRMLLNIFGIFVGALVLYGILYFIITFIFWKPLREHNKNELLKKFIENKEYFLNCTKELKDHEVIIDKNLLNISGRIHKENSSSPNGVSIIDIKRKDFNKYKNTIKLMKKINLLEITKDGDNIEFMYKTSHGQGLCIVYMKDKKHYMLNHYIIQMKQIENDWYYVEIE